jgi:NAD(P)-dependent dehydrogenase (short-subunit alcohol dehydrogenase family)
VVIAGRRAEVGERLVAELGTGARFVRADTTVEAEVRALFDTVAECLGGLDCLVNSSGVGGGQWSVTSLDVTRLCDTLVRHVSGAAAAMRYAAPAMVEKGGGSIINIASIGGTLAGWSPLDYSVAKAAVIHLTRWAAAELGERGVRVNNISPGPVLTGIFAKAAGADPTEADRDAPALEPAFASWLAPWSPLRRVAVPEDVAGLAVWLASDASALVTGQDLAVDGGITVGPPASVLAEARAGLTRALAASAQCRDTPDMQPGHTGRPG